jgi:ABC-type uncharacterized transport system auxiliary subunit
MLASPSSLQSDLRAAQNVVRAAQDHLATRRRRYLMAAAFVGFLLLIAMGVSSCGSPRPIRFYQLNPPALAPASSAEPYPVTILIGVIGSSSLYTQDRIVYGTNNEGMGLYLYQRWAEPPTAMIQELLLRELRGSMRFKEVYPLRSGVHSDYLLRGRLYDFKEVDPAAKSGGSVVARVSLDLELRESKTSTTVWRYSYRQDEPVSGKDAAAVVAAIDKNVARGTSQARAGIEQYFAEHPPQAPQTAASAAAEN